MRLNAYLARAGVASRRGADELVKAGRVRVNGAPGELNTSVAAGDVVEVDGERVAPQALAYVLLHKPAGVVTTARDPQGRPTVVSVVSALVVVKAFLSYVSHHSFRAFAWYRIGFGAALLWLAA